MAISLVPGYILECFPPASIYDSVNIHGGHTWTWYIMVYLWLSLSNLLWTPWDRDFCFGHDYGPSLETWQANSRQSINMWSGLPWWRSGWESACQCREHGFEPWSGKIPHATEQLGPWATITEPARLEPVLRTKRGRNSERPAHRNEEWPPLTATRESPRTETKTQHSQK